MRLRAFCSSATYDGSDLDDYALLLNNGPLQAVKAEFTRRIEAVGIDNARQSIADIRYGPTKIPFYNYILQLTVLAPQNRSLYLDYLRFFALEAGVPVDSTDLSGSTALMWSISTKPYLDTEVADILLQAGGQINHRNRYGCVAAHDIAMSSDYTASGRRKTFEALKYFISKGGDINIADGDGVTVRKLATMILPMLPELGQLLNGSSEAVHSGAVQAKGRKMGRNEPCSCGSKKKYKVCCGKN